MTVTVKTLDPKLTETTVKKEIKKSTKMGKNKHKDRGSASFPNGSNSHISFVMAPLQVPNGSSLGGAIRNHSQKSTIPALSEKTGT